MTDETNTKVVENLAFPIPEATKWQLKFQASNIEAKTLALQKFVTDAQAQVQELNEELNACKEELSDAIKDLRNEASAEGKFIVSNVLVDQGVIERELAG